MFVLVLPGVAVSAVHRLAGVELSSILLFLPIVLSGLVPYILPIGYLLALVSTYGRLAADREWTAIRMAGVHPLVIVRPALLLALLLGIPTYWLVAEALPDIRRNERVFLGNALRETITHLSPGRTELSLGGFYLSAGYREGPDFLEAVIYLPARDGEPARTLLAERVHFEFTAREMQIYLRNARSVVGDVDLRIGDPVIQFPLEQVEPDTTTTLMSLRFRKSSEVEAELAHGEVPPERLTQVWFEIHQRRAISSIFLMFLLLGIPTGLLLRRGTQLGALSIAVGYALLYYVLSIRTGKMLVENAGLSPMLGAWTINAVGMIFGAWLTRRALFQ
jgi:lipopolysaccharide export LptBFGC system permease protein LptF